MEIESLPSRKNSTQTNAKTQNSQKSQNATTRKCNNLENPTQTNTETQNSTKQQPRKHKQTNQKRKKPKTSTQKTLTDQPRKPKHTIKNIPTEIDQPRKNRKQIKRQTKPENIENGPLVPRSTNPSRFGAEIVKLMALWCQDREFWVWVFASISRS